MEGGEREGGKDQGIPEKCLPKNPLCPRCRILTEALYCENPLRQSPQILKIASTDKGEGGPG